MAGERKKQTHKTSGGQRVTTARRPPGGPRARFGFPHDSVLVHDAPAADKRYIRQLFRRAISRLADIIDDEAPDTGKVSSTMAHIAPDGTIITAHNGTAQVTLFVRDIYSGRMRAIPLLEETGRDSLTLSTHDAHDPDFGISRSDEIYICIETGNSSAAMNEEQRAMMLGRYLTGPRGSVEKAAEFLARLAVRGGAKGSISVTFARLEPGRSKPLIIALFEGDSAEGHRLAAGMVPVITGILQRDMIMRHRTAPASPGPRPRDPTFG
jgi:hypothetical protein